MKIDAETTVTAKPFVKWAGGKQALAAFLSTQFPSRIGCYYEPFLGGGSVLLELSAQSAVVGDLNDWLLDTYEAIRKDWKQVAVELDKFENTKEQYLKIRRIQPDSLGLFQRAAQLIYLNKTCFRGLFRVNRKGQFNVPYGAYDRRYFSPENLQAVASVLQGIEIRRGDYELCLRDITEEDFAYFDPPYFKKGGYSDFNRYTPGQFKARDHVRLASFCRELDSRNVRWALSNSDTPFVRDLFRGFRFVQVNARREINLNSKNRSIQELLIVNY